MYSEVIALMGSIPAQESDDSFSTAVSECLTDIWLEDYSRNYSLKQVVEVKDSGFFHLFDIEQGRLIAAWRISQGRVDWKRDTSRLSKHPLSNGKKYHRGHAISHLMGGGLDINIVPQLGKVNTGAFQALERTALLHPGAVYFTYWMYANQTTQTPNRVDQGLLVRGQMPDIRSHRN